jgi:hypothetical protein
MINNSIKSVSGFGLIVNPNTAIAGIKIDTTVVVVPLFGLKREATNIRMPTIGIIINTKSISSLLIDAYN